MRNNRQLAGLTLLDRTDTVNLILPAIVATEAATGSAAIRTMAARPLTPQSVPTPNLHQHIRRPCQVSRAPVRSRRCRRQPQSCCAGRAAGLQLPVPLPLPPAGIPLQAAPLPLPSPSCQCPRSCSWCCPASAAAPPQKLQPGPPLSPDRQRSAARGQINGGSRCERARLTNSMCASRPLQTMRDPRHCRPHIEDVVAVAQRPVTAAIYCAKYCLAVMRIARREHVAGDVLELALAASELASQLHLVALHRHTIILKSVAAQQGLFDAAELARRLHLVALQGQSSFSSSSQLHSECSVCIMNSFDRTRPMSPPVSCQQRSLEASSKKPKNKAKGHWPLAACAIESTKRESAALPTLTSM